MARVLIFEPPQLGCENLAATLSGRGLEVASCSTGQALLEEIVRLPPGAVVYGIPLDGAREIPVLQLLRRIAPDLPLVLVAADASLVAQKLMRELRPIYYAVCPVEAGELREAVSAALARRTRGTGAR